MAALRTAGRFLRVTWDFLPLVLAVIRDRRRFIVFGGSRTPTVEEQRRRADILVETLLALGPTFIKLGQLLSTRPDVLPPIYIDRLAQLQDAVPPTPWSKTKATIEEELGPLDERFSAFDEEAISGASLGQVYRAAIDGQPVAVKVRRPGVTRRVAIDLRVLSVAVPILTRFIDEARAFSLENLADEFATVIGEEMDYKRERRMLTEIRDNFAGDHTVRIPAPIESHCTDRILTMEYVEGIKITDLDALDAAGIDRSTVAERLERAYLQMVLEDGVFHADPHPGNLAVDASGNIIFYDFGMSGRIPAQTRDEIIDFYLAVAERDIQGILDSMVELGTLSPTADRHLMGDVLELAIRDAQGEEIEDWRVEQIIARVESTMYEFPLRLPARLALVMRVATVAEGVCITLDPDFDFIEVATAFLTERGYREETVRRFTRETIQSVGDAGLAAVRSAPKAERLIDRFDQDQAFVRAGVEDPNDVLTRLALRIIYGIFAAAGIVAGSILYVDAGMAPVVGIPLSLVALMIILLWRSFRRRSRVTGRPQFTRQAMRKRRNE